MVVAVQFFPWQFESVSSPTCFLSSFSLPLSSLRVTTLRWWQTFVFIWWKCRFVYIDNCSISVAIVIAALAGPQWLFTEEKLPNTNYNGTANFNVLDDGAFITRYTKSSLWIICSTVQGKYLNVRLYTCLSSEYIKFCIKLF